MEDLETLKKQKEHEILSFLTKTPLPAAREGVRWVRQNHRSREGAYFHLCSYSTPHAHAYLTIGVLSSSFLLEFPYSWRTLGGRDWPKEGEGDLREVLTRFEAYLKESG